MLDTEWPRVWDVFVQLWPKYSRLTLEEILSYRRACETATEGRVIATLRGLKDSRKWSTPPTPGDLRRTLRASKAERPGSGPKPEKSWPDLIREQMNGAGDEMTDEQVRYWYCCQMEQQSQTDTTREHWQMQARRWSPEPAERQIYFDACWVRVCSHFGKTDPAAVKYRQQLDEVGGPLTDEADIPLPKSGPLAGSLPSMGKGGAYPNVFVEPTPVEVPFE